MLWRAALPACRPLSEIAKEVNRVMANPEINGNPVALDFSKGKAATGYSGDTVYASGYDRIFGKKKEASSGEGCATLTSEKEQAVVGAENEQKVK